MRACLALVSIAGCSFAPSASPTSTGADSTSSCPDADRDGVCDAQDVCPGFDDHIDADGDGIPDGCDDWPCGTKPDAPGLLGDTNNGVSWSASSVQLGAGGQLLVATANEPFAISFGFSFVTNCTHKKQCQVQLELGSDLAGMQECAFDGGVIGDPHDHAGLTSNFAGSLALGSGLHQIKLDGASNASCAGSWTDGMPGATSTIAIVCVP